MHQGTEYSYKYSPGSKNTPPSFRISLECLSSGSFKLTRESGFDRFFKKIGISSEIKTNDIDFDERYYISANDTRFAMAFFNSANKRNAVREISNKGFNEIHHDGKVMTATCSPLKHKEEIDEALVSEIVAKLSVLTKEIPNIPRPYSPSAQNWKIRRIIAFAIPGLFYVLGAPAFVLGLMNFRPLDGWQMGLDSLKISAPLFILFIWIAVMCIKGRSSSHRELIVVFAISLSAFFLSGAGIKMLLNGWLDDESATSYRVDVRNTYVSKSSKNASYYAVTDSWREDGRTEKLSITGSEYSKIIPYSTEIIVTTKPGKFGYEWLVGYQIEYRASSP
jgi:hypothetical protein